MGGNAKGSQSLVISGVDDHDIFFPSLYSGESDPSGIEFDLVNTEFPG